MTNVDLNTIKKLRKKHGLSQKEMAQVIGSNTVYPYHRKETGIQKFTADDIYLLSIFFDKPLEYFFGNKVA